LRPLRAPDRARARSISLPHKERRNQDDRDARSLLHPNKA